MNNTTKKDVKTSDTERKVIAHSVEDTNDDSASKSWKTIKKSISEATGIF